MKKFLFALFAVILLTTSAATAAQPVKIARLPIIFRNNIPDTATCAALEVKIARAVHVPLNKTLKLVEYIPTAESTKALNDIWKKMRADNRKAKLVDAMRPLAKKLNADIVVCPILHRYSQYVIPPISTDEAILTSNVRVELIVYDRRTDELVDKKASQMYRDSIGGFGTAAQLAQLCLDQVIDTTKLRQKIIAIKK